MSALAYEDELVGRGRGPSLVIWAIVASAVLFILWAALAWVDEIVRATGEVVSSSRPQIIQNLEGGILAELNVAEGDVVEEGQMLARLYGTQFQATVDELDDEIAALEIRRLRLEAEMQEDADFALPADIETRVPAIAASERRLLAARIDEYQARVSGAEAVAEQTAKELDLVQKMYDREIAPLIEVTRAKKAHSDAQNKLSEAVTTTEKERATDYSKTQGELASLKQKRKMSQDQLARTTLLAPMRGVVNKLSVTTIGGVVRPGEEILQIIPLDDEVFVEAKVIREVPRDDGQIALYTTGGAMLVDGHAATFGFDPSGIVTAEMSLGAGSLSGLTLNGRAVTTSGADSPIAGGELAAHFAVRDTLAPEAQAKLDALARDLVERFADTGVDPTLTAGQAGLFTDGGGNFLAANELGLAQRLTLNVAVDPQQGGALWRLRDGIGATTPGLAGDTRGLVALQVALNTARVPSSGQFMTGARSFSALQGDMLSAMVSNRLTAESEASYAKARTEALTQLELAAGVDTDQELQSLLLIEQAYTANAKVIQTVGEMIDTLLGM